MWDVLLLNCSWLHWLLPPTFLGFVEGFVGGRCWWHRWNSVLFCILLSILTNANTQSKNDFDEFKEERRQSRIFIFSLQKALKISRWSHITCQFNIPAVLMRYFLGCSVERGFISLDYAIPSGHRYKCFKAYENNFKV